MISEKQQLENVIAFIEKMPHEYIYDLGDAHHALAVNTGDYVHDSRCQVCQLLDLVGRALPKPGGRK